MRSTDPDVVFVHDKQDRPRRRDGGRREIGGEEWLRERRSRRCWCDGCVRVRYEVSRLHHAGLSVDGDDELLGAQARHGLALAVDNVHVHGDDVHRGAERRRLRLGSSPTLPDHCDSDERQQPLHGSSVVGLGPIIGKRIPKRVTVTLNPPADDPPGLRE